VLALALAGLAVVVAAILAAGASPLEAAQKLIVGSLGSPGAIAGTLRELTPLILAGIAVFIALKAGLFNIGVEGQLVVGAVSAATVALAVPGVLGMLLAILAGCAAGALWALPAGLIKAYRGGHEVITTIMLNNVAGFLTAALVAGPLKAPGQESTTTATLPASSMLPNLYDAPPMRINLALLLGVGMLVALAVWLKRSVAGYELSLVGANPRAAELAGVNTARTLVKAMAASGAVGGLAGAIQVLAYEGRFFAGFSPGYGFDALGVALLAGGSALGIVPAALLFAILAKGGSTLQFLGIPKGITVIVLGLVILVFAAVRYRKSERRD
jgi:general nucleoside transport system permease protein